MYRSLEQKSDRPKILIIMHQEGSIPGRCGLFLENMGYQLVACRPPMGDALPQTMEDYAGAVVFGGPMSANDKDEYIRREIDWMEIPLKENKPLFGICLGAQMLSLHLGGEVKANKDEFAEIGYYPISPTNEGAEMMDWPSMVYHWHREGFSLPTDATLLASGEEYPNQAFKYGDNAYGVQFHSEVTHWMMNRWTTKAAHRLVLNGAQDREAHFKGRMRYDAPVAKWLQNFLDIWVGSPKP